MTKCPISLGNFRITACVFRHDYYFPPHVVSFSVHLLRRKRPYDRCSTTRIWNLFVHVVCEFTLPV